MRVLYFGTYERRYPRNAQVISALRGAGVEVIERHEPVWEGQEEKWSLGPGAAARLVLAELRLLARRGPRTDAVIVGYPGHLDLLAARRAARGAPVVFNPLVSLTDTLVEDRGRFRSGSLAERALRMIDRRALRSADVVVADTGAHAEFLAELAGLPRDRFEVCFVGAEERVFQPGWRPAEPFTALFVGKLIPLHGLETILEAARLAPELRLRIVGSGQLDPLLAARPANVEWVPWVEYERLPEELHARLVRARDLRDLGKGAARDSQQGLPGTRMRHAARHRRHAGRARAAGGRRERAPRPTGRSRGAGRGAASARRRAGARAAARRSRPRRLPGTGERGGPRSALARNSRAGRMSSHEWGTAPEFVGPRHELRERLLLDLFLSASPGPEVLDAGAGQGTMSSRLEKLGFEVTSTDVSVAAVEFLRENLGGEVLEADLGELPFADATFDGAVLGEVLEHVEDDRGALAEVARVLRPGGVLAASVPANPALFGPSDEWAGHVRRYTRPALIEACNDAGLDRPAVRRLGLSVLAPLPSPPL